MMTILRVVLSFVLAVVLAAVTLGFDPDVGFGSNSFTQLLLFCAFLGGPGFLVGGCVVARFAAVQEQRSCFVRLTTILLGIGLGAANMLLASFLGAFVLGLFGILAVPPVFPGPALVGGVGLGLGAQIGLGRGMDA